MAKAFLFVCEKFRGLKIVIKPAKQWKDNQGNPKKEPGSYIKFENGRFQTDNEDQISFLEHYMQKYPADNISKIDIEKETKRRDAIKKVDEDIEKEEKEKVAEIAKKKAEKVSNKKI